MNADWTYMIGAQEYMVTAKTSWRRYEKKTVEELKTELEALKVTCEEHIDHEQLSHLAYILQNEIKGFTWDLKVADTQLVRLKSLPENVRREVDWQLTAAMLEGRIDAYKVNLHDLHEMYAQTVQQLKEVSFARSRPDLDNQIAEAEEEAKEKADLAQASDEEAKALGIASQGGESTSQSAATGPTQGDNPSDRSPLAEGQVTAYIRKITEDNKDK